ncbi:hypothetical protein SP41_138 [Salmonella phage 41]|nr:hypothetical protein SP41_138 [Salmonella phage 41]
MTQLIDPDRSQPAENNSKAQQGGMDDPRWYKSTVIVAHQCGFVHKLYHPGTSERYEDL